MKLQGAKGLRCAGKGASVGVTVDDGLLAKINRFALVDLAADQVFVRKQLLAHNGIDRDRERFPENLLEDFARSLPGKSVLYFHAKNSFLPLGLYFDAQTEEISVEQFKALTGEDPRLPAGRDQVKVLWAWYYVVKTPGVEEVLANIEGGVYRHWSLGFGASDLVAVKEQVNGPTLYYEYVAPGEAHEGSLVWLGAQQGATSQKAAGSRPEHSEKGEKDMKKLLGLLGALLGKSFSDDATEDAVFDAVKAHVAAKDTEISTLKGSLEDQKALAALGKAYEDKQVAEYARLKALLGECEATPEAAEKVKGFGRKMGIEYLESEVKALTARAAEKFPNQGTLKGDMRRDKSGDGKASADGNPLIV
ncbi:hypothetical protein [Geoalkalibacter sp.]|uniref:hypothetical protein n=1 Tax=Geoalkalibacter sp. TaxID=3041440 RepID=UPI00272E3E14|nr:hypothetical protein [Geoalkalibacter sp.]